jgi:hypothetical protein
MEGVRHLQGHDQERILIDAEEKTTGDVMMYEKYNCQTDL